MLAGWPAFDRLALLALALYVVSVGVVWQRRSGELARAQDTVPSIEQPATRKTLSSPVKLSFDLNRLEKDSSTVFSACALPPPAEGAEAPWKDWVAFEGKRLRLVSTESDVPAYAVRTPDGVSLCVTNHTDGPAEVRVSATLSEGVYTIERLTLTAESDEAPLALERLHGQIVDAAGINRTTVTIPAGGMSVYRWINRSRQALTAFRGAKQRIKSLKGTNGPEHRWLMVPFSECESNMAVISRGIHSRNRYDVLKHVHRAILTAAHAEALCRNFTGQRRISKESGDALTAKLNVLDQALSELSIACLGLAPETTVEPTDDPAASRVTVSVTNSGNRTIKFVKVGALGGTPIRVTPEELATFGSVKPGETARSVHTVRCAKPGAMAKLEAHIGYLAGKSPVRLRIRPAI